MEHEAEEACMESIGQLQQTDRRAGLEDTHSKPRLLSHTPTVLCTAETVSKGCGFLL